MPPPNHDVSLSDSAFSLTYVAMLRQRPTMPRRARHRPGSREHRLGSTPGGVCAGRLLAAGRRAASVVSAPVDHGAGHLLDPQRQGNLPGLPRCRREPDLRPRHRGDHRELSANGTTLQIQQANNQHFDFGENAVVETGLVFQSRLPGTGVVLMDVTAAADPPGWITRHCQIEAPTPTTL